MPRFTVSQHALPIAMGLGFGWNTHLVGTPGFVRSSAYATFGNGVTTYIVLPTTSGGASWPFSVPSENVHAIFRRATLERSIWLSVLKRELAQSCAGLCHSPSGVDGA